MYQESTERPSIGAQFAQVVKELRTEYAHATVFCCERMTQNIAQHPQHMIANLLHPFSGFPVFKVDGSGGLEVPEVEERMHPLFHALEDVCNQLEKAVDTRVFVTLVRGLWENLSDDLYVFVENLQEGRDYQVFQNRFVFLKMFQGAWKLRQDAKSLSSALNEWFRGTLTSIVGHDLTEKDLDLPLHASMTQKLLAENSSVFNMSYAVF